MFSVIIELNPHNSRKQNINRFVLQELGILLGEVSECEELLVEFKEIMGCL